MARTSEKVGRGKCPSCGGAVTFYRSKGGLLNYDHDHCETSGYARPGGDGHAAWMATITAPAAAPSPAPATVDPPAATPAPAPAPDVKKRSVFDLGAL